MIRRSLAAVIALVTAAPLFAQPARPLPLLDVPFISQSEALCGGAAAAMVLRYWGERGVTAEDFAHLVERSAGGIRTTALAGLVRERGWAAVAVTADGERLAREVSLGHPVIALIEDRPRTYHYVVIVGWHERAVVVHDPARAPFRVMNRAAFERRWAAAQGWALVIAPIQPSVRPPSHAGTSVPAAWDGGGDECGALVADGVQRAQRNDLENAERLLADATYRCGGAAPLRELAGVRLLQRRWPEVRELASEALRLEPGDEYATRLLATGRFVDNDPLGALAAWNAIGEPVVDLVRIDGLDRTRFRAVEQYAGVSRGVLLTTDLLQRTQRRLEELPSAIATRAEYAPVSQGQAEMRAHIAERPLVPSRPLDYVALGAQAAAARELTWSVTSPSGGGELLSVSWRFWPERPRYAVGLAAPFSIGLVAVSAHVERQPFTSNGLSPADRSGGLFGISQWHSARSRWGARAGVDRWEGRGTFGRIGGDYRLQRDRLRVELGADAWAGGARFGSAHVTADFRSSPAPSGVVFVASAAAHAIGATAPLDLWPSGDTGHARDALLRAHPVLDAGRLDVERLGRGLLNVSVGVQQWARAIGPVRAGLAEFIDVARIARRHTGASLTDIDVGAGIRIAMAPMSGVFRVDAARGLRDGRRVVSVLWTADWARP